MVNTTISRQKQRPYYRRNEVTRREAIVSNNMYRHYEPAAKEYNKLSQSPKSLVNFTLHIPKLTFVKIKIILIMYNNII